ncbi:MAG: hypothetical protein AAB501_03950 [Patescibacteria group bacterium]
MNQKGFIKDVVIIVLAILLLGGGYFYFSKKPAYAPAENTNSVVAGVKIYEVPELAVEFVLPEAFMDLTHKVVKLSGDQAVNSVAFSSKRLETFGCGLETALLGYLTYDNDKGGIFVGHAKYDNDKLYYIKPSGQCKADISLQDWQTLENALKSLTADF